MGFKPLLLLLLITDLLWRAQMDESMKMFGNVLKTSSQFIKDVELLKFYGNIADKNSAKRSLKATNRNENYRLSLYENDSTDPEVYNKSYEDYRLKTYYCPFNIDINFLNTCLKEKYNIGLFPTNITKILPPSISTINANELQPSCQNLINILQNIDNIDFNSCFESLKSVKGRGEVYKKKRSSECLGDNCQVENVTPTIILVNQTDKEMILLVESLMTSIKENDSLSFTKTLNESMEDLILQHNNVNIYIIFDDYYSTILNVAITKKNVDMVSALLEAGADPTISDKSGRAALHACVAYGNLEILELLIFNNKTDINQTDSSGTTALHLSVALNRADMAEILLNSGADPYLPAESGETALHLASSTDLQLVKLIIEESDKGINATDQFGRSPLYMSVSNNQPLITEYLLKNNADLDIPDIFGRTPLIISITGDEDDITELLLFHGADPYFSDNPLAMTPLHLAVMNRKHKIVENILSKSTVGINSPNKRGGTPLQFAVINNDTGLVKMLLEKGADPYTELLREWTVLHIAADKGFTEIARLLLSYDTSGIDKQNDLGQTALYRSALLNSTDVFDLLMKYNANTTISTSGGYTTLMVSAAVGSYHMVDEILKRGKHGLDDQNMLGETALLGSAKHNNTDVFRLILSNGAKSYVVTKQGWSLLHEATKVRNKLLAELLLKNNKTIINIQDQNGNTALHIAAKVKDSNMLECLLRHGSDSQITNNDGFTALHILVLTHEADLVNLHLELNSSGINKRTGEGSTALPMSILEGFDDISKMLMNHGANPYIPNDEGMTSLHLAAFKNRSEIVELILSDEKSGINMQTKQGQTALHYALDYPIIVNLLLKYGANELYTDVLGQTALHFAVDRGIIDTVLLILAKKSPVVNISDENGQSPLHYALNENRTEIALLLLNSSANPNSVSILGLTPLHLAVKNDHKIVVKFLLDLNKSLIDQQTHDGYTALHIAIDNNRTDIMELLFAEGADPSVSDYSGYSAYHFAVARGDLHALKLFLGKNISSINIQSVEGVTLLGTAAANSNLQSFEYLLSRGADYLMVDNRGYTIIHHAAAGGNEIILQTVVNIAAHLINTTDFSGMTPLFLTSQSNKLFDILFDSGADPFIPFRGVNSLHMASSSGNIHALEKILNKYWSFIEIRNHIGMTPLRAAVFGNSKDSVEYLIKCSANILDSSFFNENFLHVTNAAIDSSIIVDIIFKEINKTLSGNSLKSFLNQQNAHGLTPLAKAANYGNELIFKTVWNAGGNPYIQSIYEDNMLHQAALGGNPYIVEFVLNNTNIGVNSKNYNGVTPLMNAAKSGMDFVFDRLLLLGAIFNETSSLNETLLHFAAAGGNVNIVQRVLKYRSTNIDAADVEGYTPLMYACIHGHFDAAKILLEHNADFLVKNIYGETALELAAREGDITILTLFQLSSVGLDEVLGSILASTINSYRNLDDAVLIKMLLKHSTVGRDPILIAAAEGDDVQLLKALKRHPIPKKIKIPFLMKRLMKDYDSLIEELLVDEPVNVSGFDRYITPLDVALLFFGKTSTVKLLIDNLKINLKTIQQSKAMWTPLDFDVFSMARYKQMYSEKRRTLHYFLNIDKTLIEKPNVYGWTIAHKAAWFGNIMVMQFLKNKGLDLQRPDKYGRTPIHIAALKGYPLIVQLLLRDSKENVNKRDLYGFTPLHLVQVYGRRKFFSRLSLAKSDMDAESRYSFLENVDPGDAYLGVKTRSYQETIFALLDNGANINSQDGTFGWTPLHWAAVNGDVWKTVTLVMKGAALNLPSRTGVTPLWLARLWGRKTIYHYLKSKGGVF